ncbi:hypothetical protein [Egbenema bharatensis]
MGAICGFKYSFNPRVELRNFYGHSLTDPCPIAALVGTPHL